MNEQLNFEKLQGYKKALDFADDMYNLTKGFPKSELFGITSQLRRAALSISLNIAEGAGRYGQKEKTQFYRVARSSALECIPLIELAKRQNYIKEETYSSARAKCIELTKIISGLIKAIGRSLR